MHQFGETSKKRKAQCQHDLRVIMQESLRVSKMDFGIGCGHRTPKEQLELFKRGRIWAEGEWHIKDKSQIITYCDGTEKLSNHNYYPSRAFDIYAFVNGKISYAEKDLIYLGGIITGIAEWLFKNDVVDNRITWGGNWDNDGVIITDQSFLDLPHYEIRS